MDVFRGVFNSVVCDTVDCQAQVMNGMCATVNNVINIWIHQVTGNFLDNWAS